jgi:hypothetical protein
MTGDDATSDRDGHGMGDERSGDAPGRGQSYDDGAPEETRPRAASRSTSAHGGRTASGPSYGHTSRHDDGDLEALLAAALRGEKPEGEAERRAVDAFRVARDAGAHRARTRRRDDWRPRAQRRRARSLKATLSVLLASLTLGGVAYAAIGAGGGGPAEGAPAGGGRVRPSVATSAPAESPSGPQPSPSAPADRPATAKNTLAQCVTYEKLRGRGKALDSTAYQRLAAAAGGAANVSAYCAALTHPATAEAKPGNGEGNGKATTRPTVRPTARPTVGPTADKNQSRKHG